MCLYSLGPHAGSGSDDILFVDQHASTDGSRYVCHLLNDRHKRSGLTFTTAHNMLGRFAMGCSDKQVIGSVEGVTPEDISLSLCSVLTFKVNEMMCMIRFMVHVQLQRTSANLEFRHFFCHIVARM